MDENELQKIALIGDLFRQLFEKLNRVENKKNLYKELDALTLGEINTIIIIGRNHPICMSEIANALGVTYGTPTITIDRLINKGYVERIRDQNDRRQVFINLSQTGLEVYEKVLKLKLKVSEKVFGILSKEETESALAIVSKVNAQFDKLIDE